MINDQRKLLLQLMLTIYDQWKLLFWLTVSNYGKY